MASSQIPFLSQLGLYRISSEKQETLIKLMVLSICGILCKSFNREAHNRFIEPCFHTVAFSTRLFAVLRFESVIHEFDP